MVKRKSIWFNALLMSVLMFFLVACGGGDSTEDVDTSSESDGDEQVTEEGVPEKPDFLKVWVNDEERQLDAYEQIFSNFTDEYGIEVELIPYSMLDQLDGISLDGPSGQGPDLFFQPHDRIGDVHLQGVAAELEFTEEQQARLAGYNESALTSLSYDGIQYGIPAVVETYALFINTDLVDQAPETYEELIETAKAITNGDTYGFLVNPVDYYFMYPFITKDGAYTFGQDADGVYDPEDIGLNVEGAVSAGEDIQSWFDQGLMPQGLTIDIVNGLFMDGQAAMVVNGPWAIQDYLDALGDSLEVVPFPTYNGERLNTHSGNKGWLVNYYTENQYWATELALYITNEESSKIIFEDTGELPAHTSVVIDDEFMNAFFEQTLSAHPMPNIPEMSQIWTPMEEALTFISQGDDVQEVLDEAVHNISENIAIMGQ